MDKKDFFVEYAYMNSWRIYLEKILDSVFPKQARVLKLEEKALGGMLQDLPLAEETPLSYTSALFSYKDGDVRELVWQIKYKQNYILTKAVAKLLFDFILDDLQDLYFFENHERVLIIPVPATKKRMHERGVNQAVRLVQEILLQDSEKMLESSTDCVSKIKDTVSQTKTRSKRERLSNLVDAFRVTNPERVRGENIIIIDDVITTGSTIKELTKILKNAGAKSVRAYTIAH